MLGRKRRAVNVGTEEGTGVLEVFLICAAIFAVGMVWWAITEKETIRRYRDNIEAACEEADTEARTRLGK
jgi:hypothetical protein